MDFHINLIALIISLADFANGDSQVCHYRADGETKYYVCPRNEKCCNYGCCLPPSFQFYQLWYYWLMVIFMLLICSGGQWWYRYWLHAGPADLPLATVARSISTRSSGTAYPVASSRITRPTRVTYHPTRETVVVQHIWKPPEVAGYVIRGSPPPSYSQAHHDLTVPGTSDLSTNRMMDDVEMGNYSVRGVNRSPKHTVSPYNQIYGPPPSYESVIAESASPVNQTNSITADSTLHQLDHTVSFIPQESQIILSPSVISPQQPSPSVISPQQISELNTPAVSQTSNRL